MQLLSFINYLISIIFVVCYAYQFVYVPVVWFFRRRKEKKDQENMPPVVNHDYAALICARNESAVIGDLIDSLNAQTYPKEHLTVFVIADNCTDNTAEIARNKGAVVYERFNTEKVGKGYALEQLLLHIEEDYPGKYEGFFVFDADNLLEKDFVEQMNKSFCRGQEIITSYRNSKNFGSSWLSAGQGLWFLRESRYLNHARYILNISGAVSGTGFLFGRKVYEEIGGWPYHLLTEDLEFSIDQIVKGRKVSFCPDAVLYDEQPVKFSQSWRQRARWSRGYLQVLRSHAIPLLKGIFKGSFSCFDVLMNIAPAYFLTIVSIITNVLLSVIGLLKGDDPLIALTSIGQMLVNIFFIAFAVGAITTITEWKRINEPVGKKILYTFTFPLFMFTFVPIAVAALFYKTSWKPITHTMSVEEMNKKKEKKKEKEKEKAEKRSGKKSGK